MDNHDKSSKETDIEYLVRESSCHCSECHTHDYSAKTTSPLCMFCHSGPIREWEGKERYGFKVIIAGKCYFSALWRGICSACKKKQLYVPRFKVTCKHCNSSIDWLPAVCKHASQVPSNFIGNIDRHRKNMNTGLGGR